ncbi:MAG: type II CRISPR RNA-guided endonuclease Cas9 [Flavobacteriales bacterium]|nr:type II CRISPR RNA-guided endonuclease Cas9 [Flavobacteriales bacterium]
MKGVQQLELFPQEENFQNPTENLGSPNISKKILGLDLGVSSIGWALIHEKNEQPAEIMGMGVRIVPLDKEESDEFTKGNAISKNRSRTQKRTQRKGYYRYTLRRKALTAELKKHGMFDDSLFSLPQLRLWELRANAVHQKVSLLELGRILYHLNQKRGYKSTRAEENDDKKDTAYVEAVKNRYQLLKAEGKTIGQKFFEELSKNPHYRTKQEVFPREAYMEEFDAIMQQQQQHYPDVLTPDFISHLRNDIIYHQRKLKSQKGLVSVCEFEGFHVTTPNGKVLFTGPKVAHRSNPLFQIEKIWESIQNITIKDRRNQIFQITPEKKLEIFNYLDNHEKLSRTELFKILEIKDKSGWFGNKMLEKGIQGNTTKALLKKELGDSSLAESLLKMDLSIQKKAQKTYIIDPASGEVKGETEIKIISDSCIQEPLYQLWHTIYSIPDVEECKKALMKKFGLDEERAERLAKIDFSRFSFGNKSVKAIRKILPYLMDGFNYSEAAGLAGYRHFVSGQKGNDQSPKLLEKIPLLKKNALRQPVVEKILNQMIHIVNDILDEERGWVTREEREKGYFEIRVELARELKQSKEERNQTFSNLNKIEKENNRIAQELIKMGLRATRKNIIKYRLFTEISGGEGKINAMCIYTGRMFSLSDALNGNEIDVEHIIPQSLLFDDSQSNKTLTFRWVNQEKGDKTAFDYMASKGEEALQNYIQRVNELYVNKVINKAKRDKLLMPASKIPQDFIDRQLRQTQYIARKSREILSQVCKNVWSTSGHVTSYLRRLWGWDDVLMNLHMQRIRELIPNPLEEGITEIVEWENPEGQKHRKEVIKNWTKRDDHRHHAIDALVVACTRQGYIQRINTLSAMATRQELFKTVQERNPTFRPTLSLLDRYFILQKPFTTRQVEEKAAEIIISYKPGKKVATWGKRFVKKNGQRIQVQSRILVPRGPLSEESVYGKIKILEKNKPVKYLLENPDLIFKPYIKELVVQRLAQYNGDARSAYLSLKNNPIYLDAEKKKILEYGTCYKEEYVIKYPLNSLKLEDLDYVVDPKLRSILASRLEAHNKNSKEAFKEPVFLDSDNTIPVRSVRLMTGLSAVEPIQYDAAGRPVGFVKPGNNHHIAIYEDPQGNKIPHLCTFWHAVERKKYGLPVIIHNSSIIWNFILENNKQLPQSFLQKLPSDGLKLIHSFQENEMFILGLPTEIVEDAVKNKSIKKLIWHIFRVQKMSIFDIYFRHHLETQLKDDNKSTRLGKFFRIKSVKRLIETNPIKIEINKLGEIRLIK